MHAARSAEVTARLYSQLEEATTREEALRTELDTEKRQRAEEVRTDLCLLCRLTMSCLHLPFDPLCMKFAMCCDSRQCNPVCLV